MRNPWRLTYPGVALPFGTVESGYVFAAAPDLGARSFLTEDTGRPRGDGRLFGQDYVDGRTITFDLAVHGDDEDEARQRLGTLSRAWRADAVRLEGGAVATLESDRGRVAFGRPRRFASTDEALPQGLSLVTADFETADDAWYGPENRADVDLVPPAGGGLVAPLASPLSTTATSDRSRVFTVGGTLDTWPIFEIRGPITNPVLEVMGAYRLELRTTLTASHRVVIDTRPFARSILRNGASIAGTLAPHSGRLSQAALPPGTYELVLRGTSEPGTARATVRWRDAYPTP